MQRGMLLQGALLATQVAAQRSDYGGLTVGAASIGAQLISQRNSRGAELESDLYGMRYMAAAGYDPSAAVSLQETFVRLSEGRQAGCSKACLHRIRLRPSARLKSGNALQLGDGGDVGASAMARITPLIGEARLRRARPKRLRWQRIRQASPQRGRATGAARRTIQQLLGDIELNE
jgi:hypothetical protein